MMNKCCMHGCKLPGIKKVNCNGREVCFCFIHSNPIKSMRSGGAYQKLINSKIAKSGYKQGN